MADETETQNTTPDSIGWPTSPRQGVQPPTEPPPRNEATSLQSQSGAVPPVIRGWYAPPAPWQVQSNSPATPTPSQTASQNAAPPTVPPVSPTVAQIVAPATIPSAAPTVGQTPSQILGQMPNQLLSQTLGQTPSKAPRASPLSTEDDLELLRIAVYYKDRFTSMKGNASLYESIADVWRANTGRNINQQTVHKHVTERLKVHGAILSIPKADRARMNATEAAIFDYANEIYEVLQQNLRANEQRKEFASVGTRPQISTNSAGDGMADESVQRARDKRPINEANPTQVGMLKPPTPPISLHTEMALFLSMMNTRAASEASTAAKRSDITRLERRIDSMAATMDGMMALLRTIAHRQSGSN
ncbi:uncharacterized protein N7479_008995 [Penicillium vulpinum]|uniref:Uncharacterized protein n=1 Tax=Penicillium vulpinum TaxID=29845 RepID=A0A1V6RU60_9EURO|nr:uncharacterized protein N7479_008995 [Penicillium vulpinum]KAJ5950582.1 hypothetical protein N7479_008995 [Penicillium vulpinum]OQE04953.1 hypothetical protein PENVUL_c028G04814 [Penicillium vulpinum]